MQEHSTNEDPMNFSQDLKNFALRVAQVRDEDLITEHDFEMFKELKFITMDQEFLASISVLPPRHWKDIRDYGSSIQDLLSWLSDVLSSEKPRKLYSISLMKFDPFLCMCESSTVECRIVFLYRFCRILNLEFTDQFLRDFAECMEFTEDSLSFDFFPHFFIIQETCFPSVFAKILQCFHGNQLKRLSIIHLHLNPFLKGAIMRLIYFNRTSLTSLELITTSNRDSQPVKAFPSVHLPNLERLVVERRRSPLIFNHLTFGKKITWAEFPMPYDFPKIKDGVIYFENRREWNPDIEDLLGFLLAVPHLECIIFDQYGSNFSIELKNALKSLVSLKKISIIVEERVEDFIGSKIVEDLEFEQTKSRLVNWSFISSLEQLRKLCIGCDFKPKEPFFDFLKLDRLEMLSIFNRNFDSKDYGMFFQTIRPLKNLKTLALRFRYVQNAVLSDKIETLILTCSDYYLRFSRNTNENIENFIRGPGVKNLYMRYGHTSPLERAPKKEDYSFLLTVDLRQYFPLLERVKFNDLKKSESYKVLKCSEPLCEEFW